MSNKLTPTLIICLAGAVVAGLALARPGDAATAGDGYTAGGGYNTDSDEYSADYPDDASSAGSSTETTSAAEVASGAETSIHDFGFDSPVRVEAGATLIVSNDDPVGHTLTAVNGEFDTGTVRGSEGSTITAPSEPGTYQFFCAIHPSMKGELIVE